MLAYPPIVVRLLFDAEIAGAGASMSAASPAVAGVVVHAILIVFLVLVRIKHKP